MGKNDYPSRRRHIDAPRKSGCWPWLMLASVVTVLAAILIAT